MIENLLSFSAWQTSSVGLEPTEFRLRPLVKQVLENQQLTLLSQRVRLDVRVEDVTLVADRGKIRLILENLVSNAVKYSPKGGTIHLQARTAGRAARARRGRQRPRHPEGGPRRTCSTRSTPGAPRKSTAVKGTGIGLSVVLEFVSAHGGTVQIIDGEFPGAHFRITMPIRAAGGDQPARAAAPRRRRMRPEAPRCAIARRRGAAPRAAALVTALLAAPAPRAAPRHRASTPRPRRPSVDRGRHRLDVLADYLQLLQRLVAGRAGRAGRDRRHRPARLRDRPDAEPPAAFRPGPGTPGHPATDLPRAQRLLRELMANPEMLLPAERALAFLELQQIDDHLTLEAENRRLQS